MADPEANFKINKGNGTVNRNLIPRYLATRSTNSCLMKGSVSTMKYLFFLVTIFSNVYGQTYCYRYHYVKGKRLLWHSRQRESYLHIFEKNRSLGKYL